MLFRLVYFVFLVVSLLYPTTLILGPISIRHLLSIVVLGLCVYERGLHLDRFLKWYFGFLFFYTFIEVATGYSSYIFPKLLGTYLACISLYLATKIMIEKYETGSYIIYTLVALGFINAIEVIGQYFGSPLAIALPQILHMPMSEEDIELFVNSEPPLRYVAGLMGIVNSGYFLSATSILALYNQKSNISIFNWFAFAVIFLALFLVQERSGFIFGSMCVCLFLIIYSSQNKRTQITTTFIFIIASLFISEYLLEHVSLEDMRYTSAGLDDPRRIDNALKALKWIISYPAGGANYFYKFGGYYPHNFFLNAFLYGGFIGGSILIGILFMQILKIGRIIYSYLKFGNYSPLILVCSLAYLCYTLNSFLHNYSLVFGGEMIFLLWAMIGSLYNVENKFQNEENCDLEEIETQN